MDVKCGTRDISCRDSTWNDLYVQRFTLNEIIELAKTMANSTIVKEYLMLHSS